MSLKDVIFKIMLLCSLCISSNSTMELEELKQFAYPKEFNRSDMTYIETKTSTIHDHLKKVKAQAAKSLHITLLHSHEILLNISGIDDLSHLAELWIVRDIDSALERVSFRYAKDNQSKLLIRRFHLHASYDVDDGSLVRFVDNMDLLELLDFAGIKNSLTLRDLLKVLGLKPLKVLKLNYVVALSIDISVFKFEFNPLEVFKYFNNSNLMCLEWCGNLIIHALPGLGKVFRNLKIANFSNNELLSENNFPFLVELLLHPSVEIVNVSNQGITRQKRSTNRNTDIPETYSKVEGSEAKYKLQNELCSSNDWLNFCQLWNNPQRTGINCTSFSVNISLDHLFNESCTPPIVVPVAKNMKEIIMDRMHWLPKQYIMHKKDLKNYKICFSENKIEKITFSGNKGESILRDFSVAAKHMELHGLESLSFFDISHNGLDIVLPEEKILTSFPNLKHLELQGNNLTLMSARNGTRHMCDVFKHLQYLDLSSGKIQHIPEDYFFDCSFVTEVILEDNLLHGLDLSNLLKDLSNVRIINFANNHIQMLPKAAREKLLSASNKYLEIDLSNNPLICNCSKDSIATVRLLQESVIFKNSYKCYQTYSTTGYQFIRNVNADDVEKLCNKTDLPLILIPITTISLAVALCCCTVLLWRYRFHLLTQYRRLKWKMRTDKDNNFTYDIFLSYCKEDRIWVHNVLVKKLQDVYGFKLCIHYRDFGVGEDIDDEIVKHMSQSKAHIVILSKDYVRKQWPTFELKRAYTEHVQHGKEMIVIKYGLLPSDDLPGLVEQILDAQIYLEWKEAKTAFQTQAEKQRESLFWARLVSKLYGQKYPCCWDSKCGSDIDFLLNEDTPLLPYSDE